MRVLLAAIAIAGAPSAALASETVTYSYDSLGRLTQVNRSGSVNNGVVAIYAHDKADNRTSVTVSGSPNGVPPNPSIPFSQRPKPPSRSP